MSKYLIIECFLVSAIRMKFVSCHLPRRSDLNGEGDINKNCNISNYYKLQRIYKKQQFPTKEKHDQKIMEVQSLETWFLFASFFFSFQIRKRRKKLI